MKGGKQNDMPNTTELNVRIKNKISSSSEWATNDIVLMQGEIGIERTESEGDKIKIGDGVSTFSQLPYFGGSGGGSGGGGTTIVCSATQPASGTLNEGDMWFREL